MGRYPKAMSLSLRLAAFPLLIAALPIAALSLVTAVPAQAQEREVPYWASIRVSEVNMRVGPSETYRISWVYRRPQLPLKVLRLKEGWRLVQDPDGTRGWVVARFLVPKRTAIVRGKGVAEMREKADGNARLLWRLEPGVVGRLGDCDSGWCKLDVDEHAGYVRQNRLWGAGNP